MARALGGGARVTGREVLEGGYSSPGVERVDLDIGGRRQPVVLKRATHAEVAAMRAIAVVPGVDRPRALATGADWLVLPFVHGAPLAADALVPAEVWEVLASVHAHWWRKRPRGLPVVDAAWWARLCDQTLVAVRGGLSRTGDPAFASAQRALVRWRDEPRIRAALSLLPRTLTHSDPHRGNVLVDSGGAVLIDWGNARVAPAGADLAVLRAQGAVVPPRYEERLGFALSPLQAPWADVHVNVQYMGFAADHLGAGRVQEMVETADRALEELGAKLPDDQV